MNESESTSQTTLAISRLAIWLIVLSTLWYLFKELAPILRPLMLAVLLGYVVLPVYLYIKRYIKGIIVLPLIALGSFLLLVILAIVIRGYIEEFRQELPSLSKQLEDKTTSLLAFAQKNAPWLSDTIIEETTKLEARGSEQFRNILNNMIHWLADIFGELFIVGLYLIFMLIEANRIPARISRTFSTTSADPILTTIHGINEGMVGYVKVKILASLLLAFPILILMWIFGIPFSGLWAVLTFFCNFVPYLGSIIACGLPGLFILVVIPIDWQSITVILLMIGVHLVSASYIEPTLIGRAIGLSPVVILASLGFWSLCWGFVGVLVAVPVTVMIKIIMLNIPSTAPIAKLLGDD